MLFLKPFKTRASTPDLLSVQPAPGSQGLATRLWWYVTPVLLMALQLFAAFTNGGYFIDSMTLCVVAAWLILALTSITPPGSAGLPSLLRRPPVAVTVMLALLLWVWTGASMLWSIAGSETWIEFNRTGAYFALLLTGLVIGRDAAQRKAAAWMLAGAATLAAIYGLGPRLLPSLVDNLDNLGRIAVPVGYTNAQGLLMALFIPVTLHLASARSENRFLRLAAAEATALLSLCLFFTYSRGATYTLGGGLLVYLLISPLRLRVLTTLVMVVVPVAAVARWSNEQPALKLDGVPLDARLAAAANLRVYILAALAGTGLLFIAGLVLEKKISLPVKVKKIAGPVMAGLIIPALLVGAIWFSPSKSSLSAWAGQKFTDFTAERVEGEGAGRLLSLSSAGRWQIWGEAIENWQENKLTGSGGQSFPLTHLMKREEGVPFVKQAHSLPFGLLSELGLVGFIAMGLFVILTLFIAIRRLMAIADRQERGLAAALLTVTIIYLVHTSFDWDWNMMVLTMPYFLFTGILVGWTGGGKNQAPVKAEKGGSDSPPGGSSFSPDPSSETATAHRTG